MADKGQTIEIQKGAVLISPGEDVDTIYIVANGTINAYAPYGVFSLTAGSIVGLSDSYYGISVHTYVAFENSTLIPISIRNISDIASVCNSYKDNLALICSARIRHIMDLIRNYLTLVVKCRKNNPEFALDNRIEKWELDKYNGIANMPDSIFNGYYTNSVPVATAFLIESARFAILINDASLEMSNLLNINMEYVPPKKEKEAATSMPKISDEEYAICEEEVSSILKDSLKKILLYSHLDEEDQANIYNLITTFKKLPDRLSQDESIRKLRRNIISSFYELYYAVFKASLDDDNLPLYINLFLHFGYMDEELLSTSHQVELYRLSQDIEDKCNSTHIYTIYNWLKHILWEEKEPSKNTLDQSYPEFIREQCRTGKLNISESEALSDSDMKLKFEITNMFSQAHRMTYGRASSFVPILIDENIYKPLDKCFLSAEDIVNTVNYARSIDFSLFYRTIVFSGDEAFLSKEYIYKEVLPDIILMPGLGTGSAMWQEIEGRHRDSSARIMLPILCNADLNSIALNAFGKYRWELCKRIQGAYWNNLAEKSLTAEYYDYLQFYKKNHDLSEAVKEKIKSTLINCRNNFTEVFAKDYEQWVLYESKGISKLNKVVRVIMGRYCPFDTPIRANLKSNPAYNDTIEAYERYKASQKKHYDLLAKSLIAKGYDIPDEIKETIEHLNR